MKKQSPVILAFDVDFMFLVKTELLLIIKTNDYTFFMKKKITRFMLTVVLLVSFLVSYTQPLENYYIVTLKGDIIKSILSDYPAFSYLDLTVLTPTKPKVSFSILLLKR